MAFTFRSGASPLLISFPHSSTYVPSRIADGFTERGRGVPDTDWYLPELYQIDVVDKASPTWCASVIQADFSRFVIDPNRPVDGTNLYPGQPTPALCPVECFDGSAIYQDGKPPSEGEISRRRQEYWQPYHDKIREELGRIKEQFGFAVLFDAHSILSRVPRLFEGRLPNINIGTNRGHAAGGELTSMIEQFLVAQSTHSSIVNGRFVGGFITRNYGDPADNIHAIQLELTQENYMNEMTGEFDPTRADRTRPVLFELLRTIEKWTQLPTRTR